MASNAHGWPAGGTPGRARAPCRRRGNPILTLGLVGGTVVALVALLAFVLSQGGSSSARPAPTAGQPDREHQRPGL